MRNKKLLLLIIAIIVVIIAGLGFVYVAISGRNNEEAADTTEEAVMVAGKEITEAAKVTTEEADKKKQEDATEALPEEETFEETSVSSGGVNGTEASADKTTEAATREEVTEASTEERTTTEEATQSTTEASTKREEPEESNECKHDWKKQTKKVKVKEKGHYEKVCVQDAWDEEVTERHTFCGKCDKDVAGIGQAEHCDIEHANDLDDHGNPICWNTYNKDVVVDTIHHDAVYEEKWVVDEEAHTDVIVEGYKCSKCGATK